MGFAHLDARGQCAHNAGVRAEDFLTEMTPAQRAALERIRSWLLQHPEAVQGHAAPTGGTNGSDPVGRTKSTASGALPEA